MSIFYFFFASIRWDYGPHFCVGEGGMENEVKGKEDESGAGGCANVTWPVCWCTWMVFHYGDVAP